MVKGLKHFSWVSENQNQRIKMANQNQEKNHTEPNKTQSKTSKLLEARENASNQPVIGLAMHLIGWIESATFSGSIRE